MFLSLSLFSPSMDSGLPLSHQTREFRCPESIFPSAKATILCSTCSDDRHFLFVTLWIERRIFVRTWTLFILFCLLQEKMIGHRKRENFFGFWDKENEEKKKKGLFTTYRVANKKKRRGHGYGSCADVNEKEWESIGELPTIACWKDGVVVNVNSVCVRVCRRMLMEITFCVWAAFFCLLFLLFWLPMCANELHVCVCVCGTWM